MSSRADVQPGGPPKKPHSTSSPPVVYANGLEVGKVPRVPGVKVRQKGEGELPGKTIVQVVAPGARQKKALADAPAAPKAQEEGPGAAPKQGAGGGSSSSEDRANDKEEVSSSGQGASSSSKQTRRSSHQARASSSAPAATPPVSPGKGEGEGAVPESARLVGKAERGAAAVPHVRIDASQGRDQGAGPASESAAVATDRQSGEERGVKTKGASKRTKGQPEPAPPGSTRSANRDQAAASVPERVPEVQANGAAATARVVDSQGASTAGDADSLARAHHRVEALLSRVSPKKPADARRQAIVHYVHTLINSCFPAAVSTFGSVPLKTYLPDGDIDVVAFAAGQPFRSQWANEVRAALDREEKKQQAEFRVREVQFIQAEVKLIKCLIENIVVDISFNQLSGICTLCFLEVVDRQIGRAHLFKRAVILVKAWCYYESRILGAHHGLISTYALETLVLYTFQVFHASLHGPLDVLYRFLSFFSSFDWDKNCLSLRGVIPLASLPSLKAEAPVAELGGSLLLSEEFLARCVERFAVLPEEDGSEGRPFVAKAMNIQDPLLYYNNLGRSVSRGNLSRIQSALRKGATTLGGVLGGPAELLLPGLDRFFANTWRRHGAGPRPDVVESRRRTQGQRSSTAPSAAQQASNGHRESPGGAYVAAEGDTSGVGARDAGGLPFPEVGAPFSSSELAEAARAVAHAGRGNRTGRPAENGGIHTVVLGDNVEDGGGPVENEEEQHRQRERGPAHVRGLPRVDVRVGSSPMAETSRESAAWAAERRAASGAGLLLHQTRRERPQEPGSRHSGGGSGQTTPSSSPRLGAPFSPFAASGPLFEAGGAGAVVEGVPVAMSFFGSLPRGSGTGAFFPSPDMARTPPSPSEPATGLPYWLLQAAGALGGPPLVEGVPLAAGTPLERGAANSGGAQAGAQPRLVGDIPIPIVNLDGPPSPQRGGSRSTSRSPPLFPLARTPPGSQGARGPRSTPPTFQQGSPLPAAGWATPYGVFPSMSPVEGLPGPLLLPPPLQLPEPASGSAAERQQAGRSLGMGEQPATAGQGAVRHAEEGRANGGRAQGQGGEQHRGTVGRERANGDDVWREQQEALARAMEAGPAGPALLWGQYGVAQYHMQQALANGYAASRAGQEHVAQQYGPYAGQESGSPRSRRQEQRGPEQPGGGAEVRGRDEGTRSGVGEGSSQRGDKERRGEEPLRSEGLVKKAGEAVSPRRQQKGDERGRWTVERPPREHSAEARTPVSSPQGDGSLANGVAGVHGVVPGRLERKGSMERGGKVGAVRQAWVAKGDDSPAAARGGPARQEPGQHGQTASIHRSPEGGSAERAGPARAETGEHGERNAMQQGESSEGQVEAEKSRHGSPAASGLGRGRGGSHRRQYSEGSIDFQNWYAAPAAAVVEMGVTAGPEHSPRGAPAAGGSLPDQLFLWPGLEEGLPPASLPAFPTYFFPVEQRQGPAQIPAGALNGEAGRGQARTSREAVDARLALWGDDGARQWSQEDERRQRPQSPSAGDATRAQGGPRSQQRLGQAPLGYPSAVNVPQVGIPFGTPFWEAGREPSESPRARAGAPTGLSWQPGPAVAVESCEASGAGDEELAGDEDLLEGDLETHLRNLEFGRHCQAQVERGQKWQPPLPPPQAVPGPAPQAQTWHPPARPAQQHKSQARSNSHPGATAPHMYGPTLRSPQGGPSPSSAAHWQQVPQQQHKYLAKGPRNGGALPLQRHGEEALRQLRGGEARSGGAYMDPGRLYMPQGHSVGVHFLEGDARQPADLFVRGGMGPGIARVRSADSYSSEGLHLDPRGVPARYLDARMQSPRLARVPHRLAPAPADFRVPHYSSKDALDMARRMREPVERPDWHSAPATYFMGANLSPHVEPAMPGFNPVSHPPHFSGGVRGGGPPEALNLGPARVYLTTQQQPSSAGCEEPLHTEPVTEGGTSQDEPPGVPKLKSIRESEEREPLPGRPDKVGGVEGAPRTGEGWERPSQPRRAVEVQGEGRGEGLAALRLERQASGGSSGGPEQQSEGRNAVLEEGPATKESSQQFSEEDFPPLSIKAKTRSRNKPGSASPQSGKSSPKGGGA